MLSFLEYASERRILELLIKERVKVALKCKLQNASPKTIEHKAENNLSLSVTEQIFLLMPPRDSWCRPQKRERVQIQQGNSRNQKQLLARSIAITIKRHRNSGKEYKYLNNLDEFIASIRRDIASNDPLKFISIKIIGKKKSVNSDNVVILRPLCVFESLREKLLIALASKYLSEIFDPFLHSEIISYRPPRIYHNSENMIITTRDNAIENIQAYRRSHINIYVAECDIQKYFDTINHDVIRGCFRKFADQVKGIHPDFDYSVVERIVDAYLDSYSFYNNVLIENEHLLKTTPPRAYEGPKDELFVRRGCYTEAEFAESKDKIGIPQGGALSGLISNVVLNTIDNESILKTDDPNRFFCRYGDDIMLMHTSRSKCEELIANYCKVLTDNKLLYHEFVSVADESICRSDGTIRTAFWDLKSRSPFLWGRSATEKESVDWIGFLGYEIRYTGEVRMRRSSLNEKFKSVKRKYKGSIKSSFARGKSRLKRTEVVESEILRYAEKFAGDSFSNAKSLNRNKYSETQALKLKRYTNSWMFKMVYKMARRNGLSKSDAIRLWNEAKQRGGTNYPTTS
ncbi:MAG: hypothetical protein J6U93_06270 [Alistipes sp.]|nr:hypothetical protein [Alistipes sp.]